MRLGVLPANDPVTDGFRCEAGSTGDATDKWILLLLGRDRGEAELRKGCLQIFWWFSTEIIWLLVQILFQRGKTNLLRGEAVKRSRWSGSTCFFHPSNGLTHPNPITFTIHFANFHFSLIFSKEETVEGFWSFCQLSETNLHERTHDVYFNPSPLLQTRQFGLNFPPH